MSGITQKPASGFALRLCSWALLLALASPFPASGATPPEGTRSYEEFVALFLEFIAWRDTWQATAVLPDYSASAIAKRVDKVQDYQRSFRDFAVAKWDRPQQVNYLAALSKIDEQEFVLRVSRPWSRDPGFYVDQIMGVAFTPLPVAGHERDVLVKRLQLARGLAEMAPRNLQDIPGDLADLALRNLVKADGVSHGQPYRAIQPEGALGWYEDLLDRAREQQPDLISEIESTQAAVRNLEAWLRANRASMTAAAGIGDGLLTWFLRHVNFIPYSPDHILALAQSDLDRTAAYMGLERHRYRSLPELEPAPTLEDYEERLEKIDADIRAWVVREEFITVPDDFPADYRTTRLPVPWMQRPTGLNFWEAIQFRDPAPDHWHATIPGHGFDGWLRMRTVTDPVRKHIRDGTRAEGWGMYLEEIPLQLGFYDVDRQRTRELIYIFQVFRAARTIGDVKLQRNEMTTSEVIEYWKRVTPFLDDDVARVDAEIYLRRPPGYGLGYTVGKYQMMQLLADRMRQLGSQFVLREFHDAFMQKGWMPIALIRYEMTGLDDEVSSFWKRVALSDVLR